jgi:hypothetical protein
MEIIETGGHYVVTFFPNAEEVEIDDKPESGYKAIIGKQDGEHVVMKVMYDKNRYDINRVIELAQNIKECPICKRLDANVANIERMQLREPDTRAAVPMAPAVPAASISQARSELFNTGNPLQDIMTRMMFDTKLNTTGQVATALALEDSALLEKVMPKSIDGVVDLMANLTELSQGKGDIYRSPEEVTAYVKALREGVKQPLDEKNGDKSDKQPVQVFRRASTVIVS